MTSPNPLAPPTASHSTRLRSRLLWSWLSRLSGRERIADLRAGFEEHGWTGNLFMIECGLGLAATAGVWGFAVIASLFIGSPMLVAATFGLGILALPVALFQWRFLLGIARFERWAGLLAAPISGIIGLGAAAGLLASLSTSQWRGVIVSGAQAALGVQYVVYFIRNREKFGSQRAEPPVLDAAE